MRKYLLILSTLCILFTGCSEKDNPQQPSAPESVYTSNFEALWQNFDRYYVFFNYKNIDWTATHAVYRPLFEKVDTNADFITLLTTMLTPLKDVHVWIKKSNGQFIQPYFPSYTVNWNQIVWNKYMSMNHWHQESSAWGWFKKDSIGYIEISSWDQNTISIQEFDSVLDSLQSCKGIIFDIRMNGGGYGPLAGSIGGRFVTGTFSCGYIQYRNGVRHTDFSQIQPLEYPQRGGWQFTKQVILLIGRGCYSTSEIFAAGMTKLNNCITVGDTTGGGLSNGQQFSLPDGTIYSISNQLIFDTDHKIVEGNGIPPQIIVGWNTAEVAKGNDPIFDYAFNLLKNK
jgi:Periplasmic protease